MGFPKDSAGSIMTPECITLRPWMTAEDALAKIRRQAFDKETGEPLFDENGDPVMESFVEYTGFLVCDMDMTGFVGGYDTVFNCGIGYFSSTGRLLEACMTWFETKTA